MKYILVELPEKKHLGIFIHNCVVIGLTELITNVISVYAVSKTGFMVKIFIIM